MFTISAVQHKALIIRSNFDFKVSKIHTLLVCQTNNQSNIQSDIQRSSRFFFFILLFINITCYNRMYFTWIFLLKTRRKYDLQKNPVKNKPINILCSHCTTNGTSRRYYFSCKYCNITILYQHFHRNKRVCFLGFHCSLVRF